MIEFRATRKEDIPQVMAIIDNARAQFAQKGIPQWQTGYPNAETIAQDIANGCAYVLCQDGVVVATVAIVLTGEPDYDVIEDGNWICDGAYAAVHRLAVDPACKKQGLAGRMVTESARIARENDFVSVRCDTHEINSPMRSMLQKNGFKHCGTIHMRMDGAPRVAYELPLK